MKTFYMFGPPSRALQEVQGELQRVVREFPEENKDADAAGRFRARLVETMQPYQPDGWNTKHMDSELQTVIPTAYHRTQFKKSNKKKPGHTSFSVGHERRASNDRKGTGSKQYPFERTMFPLNVSKYYSRRTWSMQLPSHLP